MPKTDRLHYLLSYSNRIFLNEKDREEGFKTYEAVLDVNSRIVPHIIKKNSTFLRIYLISLVILNPFLNVYYLIKSCIGKLQSNEIEYKGDKLFLFASIALPRVVANARISVSAQDKWLPLPWMSVCGIRNQDVISVFNLIKITDIFSAYFDSVLVAYYVLKKKGYRYVLPSLKTYRWFLYDRAIKRIPFNVELFFANHKDTYASLFDNLPHIKKNLIQHGSEIVMENPNNIGKPYYRFVENGGFWVNDMPYKYKHLYRVYAFTPKEMMALSMSILNSIPEIVFVGYSLKEYNENLSGEKAILIVGYYDLFYERESKLLGLLQNSGVKVFLKNHPLFPDSVYNELLSLYDFELLSGSRFPKADYVFSYSSTLALEYEALGSKIILYDKMDDDALQKTVWNVVADLKE